METKRNSGGYGVMTNVAYLFSENNHANLFAVKQKTGSFFENNVCHNMCTKICADTRGKHTHLKAYVLCARYTALSGTIFMLEYLPTFQDCAG